MYVNIACILTPIVFKIFFFFWNTGDILFSVNIIIENSITHTQRDESKLNKSKKKFFRNHYILITMISYSKYGKIIMIYSSQSSHVRLTKFTKFTNIKFRFVI